jgi:FkbM family methyltransferase
VLTRLFNLRRLRPAVVWRRARAGYSPISSIAGAMGVYRFLRFGRRRIRFLDAKSAWGVAGMIADGEYEVDGFAPRRGDRVVDIGANIGLYALWAARRGAHVRAYEPAPESFACLAANARRRRIEPVQAAIVGTPPREGEVRLYLHDERSSRSTLLGCEIGSGEPLTRSVDVPAMSIADALAEGCDLLKIDCEGGEFGILLESDPTVLRNVRRIVLEFHRVAGSPSALIERLEEAGFQARILEGESDDEPFGLIGAVRTQAA